PSPARDAHWVAAIAAADGVEAAKNKLRQLVPDAATRREYSLSIGDHLNRNRKYPEAIAMWEAGRGGAKDAQIQALINNVRPLKRLEADPFPDDDPRQAIRSLFQAIFLGGEAEQNAYRMFAGSPASNQDVPSIGSLQAEFANARRLFRTNEHSARRIMDNVTLLKLENSRPIGDVQVITSDVPKQRTEWFVVRESGEWRVLDTQNNRATLADRVLLALEQNHEDEARQWFDRLKPMFPKSEGGFLAKLDPFSDSAFVRLSSAPKLDAAALKIAAATAAASVPTTQAIGDKAVAILEQGRDAAPEFQQPHFDRAIVFGHVHRDRFADALKVVERLEVKFAQKSDVVWMKANCLLKTVGLEAARDYLAPFVTESSTDQRLLRLAARFAARLG
ncbi:MAG TPA: hypothetical protein VK137_01845, partial [Planctomycetaceae bacterium]|nr:hypothetical protein [Planctomycetaceae bacterium]